MGKRSAPFAAWVEAMLGSAAPGTRLPSQRHLAERFGLSPTTVNRILSAHVRSGRLQGTSGAGTVVALPFCAAVPSPPPPGCSLVERLLEAIGRCQWRHGEPLPPQRDLARRFAASRRALATAIRELEGRGVVHRRGRQLVIGRCPIERGPRLWGRVLLVAEAAWPGDVATQRLITLLEEELQRCGLVLELRLGELFATVLEQLTDDRLRGLVLLDRTRSGPAPALEQWRRFITSHPGTRLRLLLVGPRLWQETLPERCDIFTFGSVHTQVCRRAVDLAGALSPRRITVLHDGQRPLQLKGSLRVLPEIERRLPGVPWRLVILEPSLPGADGAFIDELLRADGVGTEYYHELVGKYGELTLERLRGSTLTVPSRNHIDLAAGDLVIASNGPVAVAVAAECRRRGLSAGQRVRLLCLRDDRECLEAGIAVCGLDWAGSAHAIVHALLDDLPVARSSRGYVRPVVRCLPRSTLDPRSC